MYSVIKGASYILAHAPDMVIHNGTTQTTQRTIDPESEYLKNLDQSLRTYEECKSYLPNQTYIGNITPEELAGYSQPWYQQKSEYDQREGRFGEIMPEDEFIGLIAVCDVFDLVKLEKDFAASVKEKLASHKLIDASFLSVFDKGIESVEVEKLIEHEQAEAIYCEGKVVGCVKRAHDIDSSLSAHVIFENLVSKASCALSLLHLVDKNNINKEGIEYVIECSEEACGDMNQRGGGNFAKAAAEVAGFVNATGSDVRGFCAGPTHALIQAASLVKAGTFKNVIVAAGGSTAKLGMNGKDHVKKSMPILEDCVAGFAVLVSENDGINPEINIDILGRHTVGTGSSPQNVITSLTAAALERAGLKLTDIDKYSVEMQNPDITKPAGAGNVPEANYKMIGALAAMRGDIQKTQLADFVSKHGMVGWAPTQGHIPSGVPYLGFAREELLDDKIKRAMFVGKGSLFLGRMTNLFDGVSFVLQQNSKSQQTEEISEDHINKKPIAITAMGSEHGEETIYQAAQAAARKGIPVTVIGSKPFVENNLETVLVESEEAGHKKMDDLLDSQQIYAAVTMHYPFPIGVSTVGRVITPAAGRQMYLATTTGTSSVDRVEGMVKNAIYGIITAKASGVKNPTLGILNVDGARQTETALLKLKDNGYDIQFAESARADGGIVMRGNDLLTAAADVMVMDSLTGNVLTKMFSAYTTGGGYESVGYGYGPGIGENFDKLVLIISRASGAPLITGALEFAKELMDGDYKKVMEEEFAKAKKAGLEEILKGLKQNKSPEAKKEVKAPPKEVVTEEILGIEIMDLEEAVSALWEAGIYAESGMGCTGPVVLISEQNLDKAAKLLKEQKYIG